MGGWDARVNRLLDGELSGYRPRRGRAAGRAHRLAQDPNPGETIIYYAWAYAPAGKLAQPPA